MAFLSHRILYGELDVLATVYGEMLLYYLTLDVINKLITPKSLSRPFDMIRYLLIMTIRRSHKFAFDFSLIYVEPKKRLVLRLEGDQPVDRLQYYEIEPHLSLPDHLTDVPIGRYDIRSYKTDVTSYTKSFLITGSATVWGIFQELVDRFVNNNNYQEWMREFNEKLKPYRFSLIVVEEHTLPTLPTIT